MMCLCSLGIARKHERRKSIFARGLPFQLNDCSFLICLNIRFLHLSRAACGARRGVPRGRPGVAQLYIKHSIGHKTKHAVRNSACGCSIAHPQSQEASAWVFNCSLQCSIRVLKTKHTYFETNSIFSRVPPLVSTERRLFPLDVYSFVS